MERAGAHATVADVSDSDELLVLHSPAQQHSGHDRDHVAQVRDWTNETLLQVAKVNVEIFAAGGSPRLRHVLREDLARSNALDQNRAEVSDQRRDEVLLLKGVSSADRSCFLAQRAKHATHD